MFPAIQIRDRSAQDWWLFASQVDKLKYFLRSFVCCTTEPFDGTLKMFISVELGEFFVLNVLIELLKRVPRLEMVRNKQSTKNRRYLGQKRKARQNELTSLFVLSRVVTPT